MKNLNGIDLLKFIMSIIIVGVHSCVFEMLAKDYFGVLINNISNVCVPTFLLYLLFSFSARCVALQQLKKRIGNYLCLKKEHYFFIFFG